MNKWIDEFRASVDTEFPSHVWPAACATVDRDGCPHARMVIVRRLCDDGTMWVATDGRSGKALQIRRAPRAELVFWLPAARVQYRLACVATMISSTNGDERLPELWRLLSDTARALFYWPAPGRAFDENANFPSEIACDTEPPLEFEMMLLEPERVDRLELQPWPHRRRRWICDGEWLEERINP